MFKKDISTQSSLLPAPLLSFDVTLNFNPEVDTDLEMDEVTTELEDKDPDYMTDEADTVER